MNCYHGHKSLDQSRNAFQNILIQNCKQFPFVASADNKIKTRRAAALDRQIDQLVYELYGLTEEEIAVVEGSM